ncbi:hypothetical protein Tco_0189874 [Tanacetum coccineum]
MLVIKRFREIKKIFRERKLSENFVLRGVIFCKKWRSIYRQENPTVTGGGPGGPKYIWEPPNLSGGRPVKWGFQPERLARGLEVGSIRRIQGIGYGVLEFLGVGTTFDIFQNIHILYLQYGILTSSGYGVLIFIPLWSLVSADTDTPYLP